LKSNAKYTSEATRLQQRLNQIGIEVGFMQSLEGVAAIYGFPTWNALSKETQKFDAYSDGCASETEVAPLHVCPVCSREVKNIEQALTFFGYRASTTGMVIQSWCKQCRGGPSKTSLQGI